MRRLDVRGEPARGLEHAQTVSGGYDTLRYLPPNCPLDIDDRLRAAAPSRVLDSQAALMKELRAHRGVTATSEQW